MGDGPVVSLTRIIRNLIFRSETDKQGTLMVIVCACRSELKHLITSDNIIKMVPGSTRRVKPGYFVVLRYKLPMALMARSRMSETIFLHYVQR